MEEGQRPEPIVCAQLGSFNVLILVVMEEGQRRTEKEFSVQVMRGLNPCCNGRGSKT